jgi:hypothetical protein
MVVTAEKGDSQRQESTITHLRSSSLLIIVYLNPHNSLLDNSEG